MTTTYIYLASGKSMNGKDSLYLQCKEKVGWKQLAFATKLKEVVADLYNFSDEQMYGSLKDVEDKRYPNIYDPKEIIAYESDDYGEMFWTDHLVPNTIYKPYLTPRRILQIFGQQQRALFPDIWAAYVFNTTIKNYVKEGYNKFIVTDVRFKNEIVVANNLKPEGSILVRVRINRPGVVAKSNPNDISETDLDDYNNWDYTIDNTSTLEDLRIKGLNLVKEVESKP